MRCAGFLLVLASLAAAQAINLAARDAGGKIVAAPASLSPAHEVELLHDGLLHGPPYESLPGLPLPQRIEVGFHADRPVLVESLLLELGTVGRDRRPTRIEVFGSLFVPGMFGGRVDPDTLQLKLGELLIPTDQDQVRLLLAEPLPLRRVSLRVAEASGSSFGIGELLVFGRTARRGFSTVAPPAAVVERAAALGGPDDAVVIEPTVVETRLFADDPELGALAAGLIASGDDQGLDLDASLQLFSFILEQVPEGSMEPLPARQRAEAILRWMHVTLLQSFVATENDLRRTLKAYRYRDLSASLLFIELGERFGLRVRALEAADHVLAQVFVGDAWLDVETTLAKGVAPDAARLEELMELRGYAPAGLRRELPRLGLAAGFFRERAREARSRGRFRDAVTLAVKALRCDPGSSDALGVLLETYSAWARELARGGLYSQALELLAQARRVDPDDIELFGQQLCMYGLWSQELLQRQRHAEAVALLEDALPVLPTGRPLLELYLAEAYGRWALWSFESSSRKELGPALAVLEPTAERLAGNPTLELYRQRIRAAWADAPLALAADASEARRLAARQLCLARYAELLDAQPEDAVLRSRLSAHLFSWAGTAQRRVPRLALEPTAEEIEAWLLAARATLAWYDRGLELLVKNVQLEERRAVVAQELADALLRGADGAVWDALALFRPQGSELGAHALDVLDGWAGRPWERSAGLRAFGRWDADSSGVLVAEEWDKAGTALPAISEVDQEEDGRVARSEAQAYVDASASRSLRRFAAARERFPHDRGVGERWLAFALRIADSTARSGDPLRAAQMLHAVSLEELAPQVLREARDLHLARWVRAPLENAGLPEHERSRAYVLAEIRLFEAERRFPDALGLELTGTQLYLEWTAFDSAAERGLKALETLDSAISRRPDDSALRRQRRQLFYQLGKAAGESDPLAGAEMFGRALAAEPEEENFAIHRAAHWARWAEKPYAQGDFDGSTERYRQLLEDNPEDGPLRTAAARFFDLAARLLMEQAEWDAALAVYDAGLSLLPEHAVLKHNRRTCAMRRP